MECRGKLKRAARGSSAVVATLCEGFEKAKKNDMEK